MEVLKITSATALGMFIAFLVVCIVSTFEYNAKMEYLDQEQKVKRYVSTITITGAIHELEECLR